MLFPEKSISLRKERAAHALSKVLSDNEAVIVYSGVPFQKPGGHDQTYPFLPHPDYYWLTGVRRPFGISVYNKKEGWIDFILPVSRDEKIWEGGGEEYPGRNIGEFDDWIKSHDFKNTFILGQHPSSLGLNPAGDERGIQETFNEVRRIKDDSEIELIKSIAHIASHGYKTLKDFIRPGVSERDIQIAYETEVLIRGAEKFPYDTIVGSGVNAATLHAIPTSKIVLKGDMVLVDGGADIQDYCVDVTRVFPASGKFSERQKNIYDIVLKAQKKSIELCRPGTEWSEVHMTSARVIADGLKDLGILKCSAEKSIETGAVSLFFPHGVGHMVGLRVRDVGGKFNPEPKKYAGARLRVDLPLKEGFLMTVEPGLYFIPALLSDEETRRSYKDQVSWSEADKWSDQGGVRIEDDIHITSKGPQNLTEMIEK